MLQFGIEVMPMNTNYRMYWCCFLKYKLMNIIVAVCISAEMNQLMIIHSSCLTVPTYNIWYVSAIDVRWSCCVHDWNLLWGCIIRRSEGELCHFTLWFLDFTRRATWNISTYIPACRQGSMVENVREFIAKGVRWKVSGHSASILLLSWKIVL